MWWPHDHCRTNAANIKRPASMGSLFFAEKEFDPEGFAGSRDRGVHRRITKKHCFCSGRSAFCVDRKIFIYAK